ncbi:hypothetical protein FA15DRAFT_603246, partial [Coprinopsis marcescibilis]
YINWILDMSGYSLSSYHEFHQVNIQEELEFQQAWHHHSQTAFIQTGQALPLSAERSKHVQYPYYIVGK